MIKTDFGIPVPIYKKEVNVYLNYTLKELEELIYSHYERDIADEIIDGIKGKEYVGITVNIKDVFIIHMPEFNSQSGEHISILIHELYHVTHALLRLSGINPTQDSEEAYSYLIEYLTNKFFEYYRYDKDEQTKKSITEETNDGKERCE